MNGPETSSPPAPASTDWGSRHQAHALVLIGATILGLYICFRLAAPFAAAIAWALALAVLFAPLQRWLEAKFTRANIAATVSILAAAIIVVVPASILAERLINEAAKGAEKINRAVETGEWRRAIEAHPRLAPAGRWLEQQIDLPRTINTAASWLTRVAASFVRGSVVQVVGLLLTFYLLFYFLRDRRLALEAIRALSPLPTDDMTRLFRRVADTIHAILYGTLIVAAAQGTLGGLMFWWLGLPTPLLWGIVMGALAIIPLMGAFIIWIPAAVFLLLNGDWVKALILTAWGAIVVGGIDNLLYPILVGNRLRLHTVLTFISIVGGLMVFGPSGVILGPVSITVTRVLLEVWRKRNREPASVIDG